MPVASLLSRDHPKLRLWISVAASCLLITHFMLPTSHGTVFRQFLWAVLTGALTVLVLDSFFYFHGLKRLSVVNDFVSLSLALPVPAMVAKSFEVSLTGAGVLQYRHALILSPLIALASLLLDALLSRLFNRQSRQVTVFLKLSPFEKSLVLHELENLGVRNRVLEVSPFQFRSRIQRREAIDLVVISHSMVTDFRRDASLLSAYQLGTPIIDYQNFREELRRRVCIDTTDLWTFLSHAAPQTPARRIYAGLKTILEPVLAGMLLILIFPLLAIVALVVYLTDPGPVLYRQKRSGHHGKTFELIKFRSMRLDAEKNGPQWCGGHGDERVTPIGRFLRASHIDELPQLWNVLRGELAFIGPRPERPEFYESLKDQVPLFSLRTLVRPGVTGWAQVEAGYAASVEESRLKLEHDLYYVQKSSPQLDLVIVLKTLKKALLGPFQGRIPRLLLARVEAASPFEKIAA